MSDRNVILKLARVIIAVAWADGQVSNEEINSLKDLIFKLRQSGFDEVQQLSAQEWARLEMYIESPVDAAERERLVVDLQNALRSERHKRLAIRALRDVVGADGIVSESEQEIVAEIQAAIESVEVGLVGGLQRLVGGAVQRRAQAVAGAPNRERFFQDFIKNKVYYALSQRLHLDSAELDLPEAELRKLSLAGGLMAKVAHMDRQVDEDEFNRMVDILQANWDLDRQAAAFVVEVALSAVDENYDSFRMMREMATSASVEERHSFLEVLFAVADADGDISFDENEEIRRIARGLNLTHKDFRQAKLKIIERRRVTR